MSTKPTATETFAEYFNRQGLRHFKADELEWMFSRVNKGVRNSAPPRDIWHSIIPTLRILDDLRAHLGQPVTLNSTYRAIPYNRSVGSPDGSQHVKFTAADFKVAGRTPAQVHTVLKGWRDAGKWVGGLGKYPGFIHIDTRGSNADW
jgi:uncharacterized protein YcbK (DUF882 family)